MKKILVINRGANSDNIGDQAINYTLVKLLQTQGFKVDSENYTKLFEHKTGKAAYYFMNVFKLIKIARKKYDFVFVGGGQLILGNRQFPLSLFIWTYIIKWFSKSKLVLFGVGVDSKFEWRKKMLVAKSLKHFDKIFVRDGLSKDNLKVVFNKFGEVVSDVVCVISCFCQPEKVSSSNNKVLFGMTEYSSISKYKYIDVSKEEYFHQQAQSILNLLLMESDIKLIYNTDKDYKTILEFQQYLKKDHSLDIEILKYNNLQEYVNIIANARCVISSRMHAMIIAGSYRIPFSPVIRNKKLEMFKTEYIPFPDPKLKLEELNRELFSILN